MPPRNACFACHACYHTGLASTGSQCSTSTTVQAKFPATLDACTVLGAWITFCLGFLLPTTVLYMAERQAKAK